MSDNVQKNNENIMIEFIDALDIEDYDIEVDSAFPAIGEPNEKLSHALLNGREFNDQHPISAITGLRDELDEIESLKTVYSNGKGFAQYYLWEDENLLQEDRVGCFVAVCEDARSIRICNEEEIFGVIVDDAAFVSGQNIVARDYKYGLVAHSGVVNVRCSSSVKAGDCVVSNGRGVAQKSENKYGLRVISTTKINDVFYAVVSLDSLINQMNEFGLEMIEFGKRVDSVATNIVSAINVANEAHKLASDSAKANAEMNNKVNEALDKSDTALDTVGRLDTIISSTQITAEQARAIAESAATSAEAARAEAVATANEASANVKDLIAKAKPLTEWTDEVSGNSGAEYLVSHIENNLATKTEVATVNTGLETAFAAIKKNANGIQTLVSSIDQYSVGEYSQAYGLTREQAESILEEGIIYIPTIHSGTRSHKEVYLYGENSKFTQEFTPGYYYTWKQTDNGYMWVESDSPLVAFFSEIPVPNDNLIYWYTDSNEVPEGYEPHALYMYSGKQWTKVNNLSGNVMNRIASMIRQTTNEISAEVTNARGSAASLSARIEEDEAEIDSIAAWRTDPDGNVYNLATIQQKANDNGASIAQVVEAVGADGKVTAASIVAAVNNEDSSVTIDADKINFVGFAKFLTADDLGEYGETTIYGGRIDTDSLVAKNILVKNTDGYVLLKAQDEMVCVGDFNVSRDSTRSSISSLKNEYNDTSNGVYIGTDGIGLGAGAFYVTDWGYLYTSSGNIGGCEIENGVLKISEANIKDKLTAATINGNMLDVSNATISSCTIDENCTILGKLSVANIESGTSSADITFDGNIVANKISVESGTIGGFKINSHNISAMDENNRGISISPYFIIAQGDEGSVTLSSSGTMIANNAAISNSTFDNVNISGSESSFYCGDDYNNASIKIGRMILNQRYGGIDYQCFLASGQVTFTNSKCSLSCGVSTGIEQETAFLICGSVGLVFSPSGGSYIGTWMSPTSIATTSDEAKKNSIAAIPDKYDAFFDSLNPSIYKYNDGTSGRIHTGYTTQGVLRALTEADVSTTDFAGYVMMTSYNEEKDEMETFGCLRYEEFVAVNTWQIQKLKARVAELEKKLTLLTEQFQL